RRLADRGNDVAGLLGEVGVEDGDVVVEDDPDVVAAAEDDFGAFGADGRVAEEDAGGDLADLVELHLGDGVGPAAGGQGQQAGPGRQPAAGGGWHGIPP